MAITRTPPNIEKGGLYVTAAEVEDVISWLRNVAPSTKSPPMSYYTQQLSNLDSLKNTCEATEHEFFDGFGIGTGTIRQRTKEFQQKVDEYAEKTGISNWIGVAVNDVVDRLRPWFNEISFEEISDELKTMFFSTDSSSNFNIIDDIVQGKDPDSQILSIIIPFLNKQLLSEANDQREYLQIKRGLTTYITFALDFENRSVGIVLRENKSNISSPIRSKIKKALKIYNHNHNLNIPVSEITKSQLSHYSKVEDSFRDDVLNVAKEELLRSVDIINDAILLDELKRAQDPRYYSVTQSAASVRGFLGEIANNAILRSLLNDLTGSQVIPTGSLLKNIKGHQEIPVDTVVQLALKRFNIQVKNYTLYDGRVQFSFSNQADNLITGRAAMPIESTVTDVLAQFFGAFHFNQPFTDEIYSPDQIAKGYMSVEQYTEWIYDEFQSPNSYFALSKIFSANIDRIIRLDDVFNVRSNSFFGQRQLYINSFFRINKYYIPASLIIDSIMQTIMRYLDGMKTTYNAVNVTSIKDTWGHNNTLDQIIHDRTRSRTKWQGRELNKTAMDMAAAVKVSYDVNFDIGKIMQEAIDNIIL